MQKPLSPKTLEKRYAELGLSDEKLQLLHTFFRCASNFYGVLPVSDAWQIFKHYEGLRVHKKDFVAFSGVAQRDASLPYAIYELRELYSDEPGGDPLDRTIVNKDMVMHGYYRFLHVYNTLENQRCQSFLVPDQEIFLRRIGSISRRRERPWWTLSAACGPAERSADGTARSLARCWT